MPNKHMKKHLTSLTFRAMHINSTVRYHYRPNRITEICTCICVCVCKYIHIYIYRYIYICIYIWWDKSGFTVHMENNIIINSIYYIYNCQPTFSPPNLHVCI